MVRQHRGAGGRYRSVHSGEFGFTMDTLFYQGIVLGRIL